MWIILGNALVLWTTKSKHSHIDGQEGKSQIFLIQSYRKKNHIRLDLTW